MNLNDKITCTALLVISIVLAFAILPWIVLCWAQGNFWPFLIAVFALPVPFIFLLKKLDKLLYIWTLGLVWFVAAFYLLWKEDRSEGLIIIAGKLSDQEVVVDFTKSSSSGGGWSGRGGGVGRSSQSKLYNLHKAKVTYPTFGLLDDEFYTSNLSYGDEYMPNAVCRYGEYSIITYSIKYPKRQCLSINDSPTDEEIKKFEKPAVLLGDDTLWNDAAMEYIAKYVQKEEN